MKKAIEQSEALHEERKQVILAAQAVALERKRKQDEIKEIELLEKKRKAEEKTKYLEEVRLMNEKRAE